MASRATAVINVRRLTHIIPVGGREPLHTATSCCPCSPLVGSGENEGLVIHHAWDLREKWERQGIPTDPDNGWAQIAELVIG